MSLVSMDTVYAQYPYGITAHFKRDSDYKMEFLGSCLSPKVEISRAGLFATSGFSVNTKGLASRIFSLPDIDDFFWDKVQTPILDAVENPVHLKNLSLKELTQLAEEIRSELSSVMSKRQKFFKASLAVVELTVALHYVFHAPMDKILWDVGEQVR